MFSSVGILKYSSNPFKLIVSVDQELSDFYRKLIPPTINVRKPMYSAHISLVREESPKLEYWNKYQDQNIVFNYESFIYNDPIYFWLKVECKQLEKIREELGLNRVSPITKSPDNQHDFHITIGNLK